METFGGFMMLCICINVLLYIVKRVHVPVHKNVFILLILFSVDCKNNNQNEAVWISCTMAVFNIKKKKNRWYTCEFLTFLSCFKMQKCVWSTFLFYGRRVLHAWDGLLLYTGRRDVKWRRPQILKVSGHMMSPASSVKLAEISRHDWCQLDDPAASPWVVNTWTASKFAQESNSSCEDVERRMKNVPCCCLLCSSGYI